MVSSLIFQNLVLGKISSPSPLPRPLPPAFSLASPSVRASPSILGRFAPSTRASPSILRRFAPSSRASPSTFDWGPWFGPPQNKFLDPPLFKFVSDLNYLSPFQSYCQKSESTRQILTKFSLFLAFFSARWRQKNFKTIGFFKLHQKYTIPENLVRIGRVVYENERWIKK